MSITIICSLSVRNKTRIIRQIGTGILGPEQSGLFHFRSLNQVKHVLELQSKNQVSIETPIPTFISVQLNSGDVSNVTSTAPANHVSPVAPVTNLRKEKPIWYLSWEEVERKGKKELLEWFENNPAEGLSLPKNKNAAETKELVHQFLAGQFEDHVGGPLTITE